MYHIIARSRSGKRVVHTAHTDAYAFNMYRKMCKAVNKGSMWWTVLLVGKLVDNVGVTTYNDYLSTYPSI